MDPQEEGRGAPDRDERSPVDGDRGRTANQEKEFGGVAGLAQSVESGRRSYGQIYEPWSTAEPIDWNLLTPSEQNTFCRDFSPPDRPVIGVDPDPEWFSAKYGTLLGHPEEPISSNETIGLRLLRGFHDDDHQDTNNRKTEAVKKDISSKLEVDKGKTDLESEINRNNSPKPEAWNSNLSMEKILEMDQMSNLFSDGLFDREEPGPPGGSSRFIQLFQRYYEASPRDDMDGGNWSVSPDEVANSISDNGAQVAQDNENGADIKQKAVRDIETGLSNLLLTMSAEEQEEVKDDVQAFKKLLDQIVHKGGSHSESPQSSQYVPKSSTDEIGSPIANAFARIAKSDVEDQPSTPTAEGHGLFANWFARTAAAASASSSSLQAQRKMPPPPPMDPAPSQVRPMEAFWSGNSRFGQRNPAHGIQHHVPSFSTSEVLNLLPLEMQSIVLESEIGIEFTQRPDVMQIINVLNTGEVVLDDIIQQLGAPHNPYKLLLAGVLKMGLNGVIPITGLIHTPAGPPPQVQPVYFHQNVYPPNQPHVYYAPHAQYGMHYYNYGTQHMHAHQPNPQYGQPYYNYNGTYTGY